MNHNHILSGLKYAERVRTERRLRRINNPPDLTVYLEIIDGGRAVRNRSNGPIPCILIVQSREVNAAGFRMIESDIITTIPPASESDYQLPPAWEALAVLPLGATFDDVTRALDKLGLSPTEKP